MRTRLQCLEKAAHCALLAQGTASPANEHLLLETARQWRCLADASRPAMRTAEPMASRRRGTKQGQHAAILGWRLDPLKGTMRGLLAPLSPHEEAALRKIGFGGDDPLEPSRLRRLLQLELIEWDGASWRLTAVGRRRYDGLVVQQRQGHTP